LVGSFSCRVTPIVDTTSPYVVNCPFSQDQPRTKIPWRALPRYHRKILILLDLEELLVGINRHFADQFSPIIRARGEDYFHEGRVSFELVEDDAIYALVTGTKPYSVELFLATDKRSSCLEASCSCPFYEGGEFCKHLWAAICQADECNWGAQVFRSGAKVSLVWIDQNEGAQIFENKDYSPTFQHPDIAEKRSRIEERSSSWQNLLASLSTKAPFKSQRFAASDTRPSSQRAKKRLWYAVVPRLSETRGSIVVRILEQRREKGDQWSKPIRKDISSYQIPTYCTDQDRVLLQKIFEIAPQARSSYSHVHEFEIPVGFEDIFLRELCATARFGIDGSRDPEKGSQHLSLSEEKSSFQLLVDHPDHPVPSSKWQIRGLIKIGVQSCPIEDLQMFLSISGWIIIDNLLAKLNVPIEDKDWIQSLRRQGITSISEKDLTPFLQILAERPYLPDLDIAADTGWSQIESTPVPRLSIHLDNGFPSNYLLRATVHYDYPGRSFSEEDHTSGWIDAAHKTFYRRNGNLEDQALVALDEIPAPHVPVPLENGGWVIQKKSLNDIVSSLMAHNWVVEAEGRKLHASGDFKISVTSGIDWFDLDAKVTFDQHDISLPRLLQAMHKGDAFIRLGDGSFGLLPEEWLKKYGQLQDLATVHGEKFRFSRPHAALMEPFFDEISQIEQDAAFSLWRDRLASFNKILPATPHKNFRGKLRTYQREGLGWLKFLREFQFGGCLADDMGLGKTVQILALLLDHHSQTSPLKPSIIVVPRTLVHNWKSEAKKFCPTLKVLDYSAGDREIERSQLSRYDLVLTTYGVLRLDIEWLKTIPFEFAILDEAHTIKNPSSQVAKASRLIVARHRLALTGTPVENHIRDLKSIFDFLNPGLLRDSLIEGVGSGKSDDKERLFTLSQGLRPFLLRRTKEQVLPDLPVKTEQILFCNLSSKQKKLYDEMRKYYRIHLTDTIAKQGFAKAKIQILEALLRLRQAACHPGLLDRERMGEPSAKIELLLEHLEDVVQGNHKALVFSQFTSLLEIVKLHLDKKNMGYEYLDGKTRHRQETVARFQANKDVKVFLISLKAGGVGLNLTAADYCFILDPWWNPAAEAQAIDRVHRIGQTKKVFAYRLIAQETVEEKILQLQNSKRSLSDAILAQDSKGLKDLKLEDLTLLLS
jgi:superfamily II DNA or RNA helicase